MVCDDGEFRRKFLDNLRKPMIMECPYCKGKKQTKKADRSSTWMQKCMACDGTGDVLMKIKLEYEIVREDNG